MNDGLFNYLVVTDELDDFLGYEPNKKRSRFENLLLFIYS